MPNITDRPLPYNIDAEQSVIGSLMLDPDAMLDVEPVLVPSDFYRESHQWIYESILALHTRQEPIDLLSVVDDLTRRHMLDKVQGHAAVASLLLNVPTAIHVQHYARIVARDSLLRQMIKASEQIAKMAYNDEGERDASELLAEAEGLLFKLNHRAAKTHETASVRELANESLTRYTNIYMGKIQAGIPTSSSKLNSLLRGGGLQRQELLVLAARPAMGKSSLMCYWMLTQAQQGRRVLVFSLEMSAHQLIDRLVANHAQVSAKALNSGPLTEAEFDRINHTLASFQQAEEGRLIVGNGEIIIHDQRGLSPHDCRHVALRAAHRYGPLDVIYLDHLQEIGERGLGVANRNRSSSTADVVATKVRAIRNLSSEFNAAVVLLAQLNRQCESRQNKRPQMSDLKDSGGVEESADAILFIYRDEMYDPESQEVGLADLMLSKHRHGPTGLVKQRFDKVTGYWEDFSPHTPPTDWSDFSPPRENDWADLPPPPESDWADFD